MLETLANASTPDEGKMSSLSSQSAGNPDIEIGWAVGAIEGEGCLTISKSTCRGNRTLYPLIIVENTNSAFIERLSRALKYCGIPHFIQSLSLEQLRKWTDTDYTQRIPKQPRKRLTIQGVRRVKRFCDVLGPYFEAKRDQVELLRQFVDLRLANIERPYTEQEWNLHAALKKAKRPGVPTDSEQSTPVAA